MLSKIESTNRKAGLNSLELGFYPCTYITPGMKTVGTEWRKVSLQVISLSCSKNFTFN